MKRSKFNYFFIGVWILALLFMAGVWLDIGPNKASFSGGGYYWILPAFVFTVTGLVLLVIRLIKRK